LFLCKNFKNKKGLDIVYKVNVYFSIAQDIRDIGLLGSLLDYFNCGLVETVKTRPTQSSYVVYKFDDVVNKIIPFFDAYPLKGKKALDFNDFKKVANITKKTTQYDENSAILKEIIKIKKA
jgi:hypothetical protein